MNKEFILALKQLEKEKGIDAYIYGGNRSCVDFCV